MRRRRRHVTGKGGGHTVAGTALAIPFTFRCQIISTSSGVWFRTDCDSTGIANGSGWALKPIGPGTHCPLGATTWGAMFAPDAGLAALAAARPPPPTADAAAPAASPRAPQYATKAKRGRILPIGQCDWRRVFFV
eukprot:gene14415-biopygen17106